MTFEIKCRHTFKILFIFTISLFLNIAEAQVATFKTAIVAFYNFENLYDTINQDHVNDDDFTPMGINGYSPKIYKEKQRHLDEVISQIGTEINPDGPAILGVAEIENRSVLEDFTKQSGVVNRNYQIVHYDSHDERGIDVALFYNPKYFKVIKSRALFVKLGEMGGEKGATRDILWVNGILLGEEVHVMVAHWPSRRGGEEVSLAKRAIAAETGRKTIDSIFAKNPNAKIIYMGDLNDDPTSPSVTKHLKATGVLNNIKPGELFNPFYSYFKKGIGTLAYNDSWNLFDQIMVSQAWLSKKQSGLYFQKAEIFNRAFLTTTTGNFKGYPHRTYIGNQYAGGYSDHFPTYLVFYKKVN